MKKQSKAEEALMRQAKWINDIIEGYIKDQDIIGHRIAALRTVHGKIMLDVGELRAERARMSRIQQEKSK